MKVNGVGGCARFESMKGIRKCQMTSKALPSKRLMANRAKGREGIVQLWKQTPSLVTALIKKWKRGREASGQQNMAQYSHIPASVPELAFLKEAPFDLGECQFLFPK